MSLCVHGRECVTPAGCRQTVAGGALGGHRVEFRRPGSRAPVRGGRVRRIFFGGAVHAAVRTAVLIVVAVAAVRAQQLGQPLQAPVRRGAYRPRTLAQRLRGPLRVQAHDHPQHHGLGLVLRQLGDERHRAAGGQGLHRLVRGVGLGRPLGQLRLVAADRGAPAAHPQMVQRPVAGYARRPAAEAVGVAAEPVEVARYLQPGLGRHVLGVRLPHQCPYVAQQPRLHSAVHSTEGVLVPVLCREYRGSELRVVPQHSLNLPCCPESQLVITAAPPCATQHATSSAGLTSMTCTTRNIPRTPCGVTENAPTALRGVRGRPTAPRKTTGASPVGGGGPGRPQ